MSKDLLQPLKEKLEQVDSHNDGKIKSDKLLNVLKQFNLPVQGNDLERYIRMVDKDLKGQIGLNSILSTFEDSKQHVPLKAIGIRLAIFLKQNKLSARKLLEKLIATKKQSKQNRDNGKVSE
mmetsp:Transcript_32138/g.31455  ORF Transcript_32138/g.31455 Transcript_32138/m.31455 type:complete len:122 (+) Transcript_32138:1261-1626(+)